MDDPIFDPWCLGEEGRSSPPHHTSRWRGAAKGEGVPSPRPRPNPLERHTKMPGRVRGPGDADAEDVLRALVLPRVQPLGSRLEAARHHPAVDDRLDEDPPSFRFRIEPWRAPFDVAEGARAAVLELLIEDVDPPTVVGRIWLDPTAGAPSEERRVPVEKLDVPWIDRLLLEFVETTLARD